MWLLVPVSAALACAGLVHREGELAESGASESILERLDGRVEVTWEVVYEGDAEDFGWIVPVPGAVEAVIDGDPARFEALRDASAPEVWVESPAEEEKRGCFRGAAKGGDNSLELRGGNGITVVGEGFTGTYDYVVVEATDAQALSDWAAGAGWSLGGVQGDLQHYVDLGHPFVLLGLHPDEGSTEGPRALPPVTLRYAGSELRFPSVMARSGATQRVTTWVVGDSRAELVEGWTHQDLTDLDGAGEAVDVLDAALAELGADRIWARTWSGDFEGRHATRFDLLAEPEVHDRDAIFGFDGTQPAQGLVIWLYGGATRAWGLLPLGLFALGWGRRR